jgi:hypothetical protein
MPFAIRFARRLRQIRNRGPPASSACPQQIDDKGRNDRRACVERHALWFSPSVSCIAAASASRPADLLTFSIVDAVHLREKKRQSCAAERRHPRSLDPAHPFGGDLARSFCRTHRWGDCAVAVLRPRYSSHRRNRAGDFARRASIGWHHDRELAGIMTDRAWRRGQAHHQHHRFRNCHYRIFALVHLVDFGIGTGRSGGG